MTNAKKRVRGLLRKLKIEVDDLAVKVPLAIEEKKENRLDGRLIEISIILDIVEKIDRKLTSASLDMDFYNDNKTQ